ncbi:histidine biosynthesis bifunctional protein HisIE [Alicyclobacillus cellulosilyticus]|uniref:Histidine biosynthesis bifunctional protein HisIE n=1 Tax=Alicyclobacillus cellulosilyticus TaxID=1003997 RepID=A0A917NHH3_9BACL|nr:histidine biosynthesis bifunctional protein HisIE [Alicyclobacillus cellulosilyticus]
MRPHGSLPEGAAQQGGRADFAVPVTKETVALERVRYDAKTGLVPVVVQDVRTGAVLMLAYADREALKRTQSSGLAWFWSRSRQAYWCKGATSGHVQRVVEMRMDCDGDAVLYLVEPAGPACHTGEETCFFRRVESRDGQGGAQAAADLADAADVTARGGTLADDADGPEPALAQHGAPAAADDVLGRLWAVIEERWRKRPQGSYTTLLFEQGIDKVAKKVGEEAVEVVIAAKNAADGADPAAGMEADAAGRSERERRNPGRTALASESADLLYHLLVLWRSAGLRPQDVYEVLRSRLS